MKTRITLLLFLLLIQSAFSQEKTVPLTNKIDHVTVFLEGAQVTRNGNCVLSAGVSTIVLKSLSPYIRENTIQIKGNEELTILSVQKQINNLSQLQRSNKVDSLNTVIRDFEKEIKRGQARKEVLSEKKELLQANRTIGRENSNPETLLKSLELFEQEIGKIESEKISIDEQLENLTTKINRIQTEIESVLNNQDLPSNEIHIKVEASASVRAELEVSYLIDNAGWFPTYDIRVSSIEKPLVLNYKGEIYQNSGVDWTNVKLRFSNADPNKSGSAPDLSVWNLNFMRMTRLISEAIYGSRAPVVSGVRQVSGIVRSAEDGSVLPGVNVTVRGTTIGTVTDISGHYSLSLPSNAEFLQFSFVGLESAEMPITGAIVNASLQSDFQALNEVVVTGYSAGSSSGIKIRGYTSSRQNEEEKMQIISTTTIQNQTTVEFEVDRPYSIPSDGVKRTIDLKELDIPATYQYYAVPKVDKDAFLVARVTNWDQYHLMEGQANLYFEDAFVGRTVLDARTMMDTLDISLGRDRSIVLGREKKEDYLKMQTIGSNKLESREFELLVKNAKNLPISILLLDQIPVAVNSDITVEPTEISEGHLDRSTGKVKWELIVPGNSQKKITMSYTVKYPKREKILLE